jgi:hypothetical protein
MNIVYVLGSGATKGSGWVNDLGQLPPTDQGFFNNISFHDLVDKYPSLIDAMRCLRLCGDNQIVKNLSLESTWNYIDIVFKYFIRKEKNLRIDSLNEINDDLLQVSLGKTNGELLFLAADRDLKRLILDYLSLNQYKFLGENHLENIFKWVEKKYPPHEVSVLTYNYDLLVEQTLGNGEWQYPAEHNLDSKYDSVQFDSGTTPFTHDEKYTLIKLHGSFNWDHRRDGYIHWPEKDNLLKEFQQSAIMAPVLFKEEFHFPDGHEKLVRYYSFLFSEAQKRLKAADLIVFIGYSFPATDPHAELMFSMVDYKKSLKVFVIDPNANKEAFQSKFNKIFFERAKVCLISKCLNVVNSEDF